MTTRNARLLMGYTFAQCSLPLIAIAVPFYQNQIGLTFQQFLMIEAIFAATLVVMEVPSGWISDLWTRKMTLAVGALLTSSGFFLLSTVDSLYEAIFCEIMVGMGVSLASGTVTALLYDDLLEHGRVSEFRRLEGKRHGFGFYVLAVSSLAGGLLYELNPYLPVLVSAAGYLIGVPCALLIKEPPRVKKAVERNPFYDAVQVMKYALRGHPEVAAIIFFVAILFGGTLAGQWTQQPYYMAMGLPEAWFGVFVATAYLIGGLGGQLGHLLEKRLRPMHILIGLWWVAILCWCISAAFMWYHAFFLLMISNIAYGVGAPVMQDALNKRVDSARRATVLSVASLMIRITFIPLGLIIGWAAESYNIQVGIIVLAGIVLVANLINLRKINF